MKLTIAHLYPSLMNIYGDRGNIQTLEYRCKQRNITVSINKIKVKDSLKPGSFDLLFAGGGQDCQQAIIAKDLQTKKATIQKASNQGIPILTICGSFQLFGQYFQPFKSPKLKGIGIFNAYTIASKQRKIGNILIQTDFLTPETLIGFENHSGNTYLQDNTQALGKVKLGFGNNGQDKTEGARINNTFGCYLHGSLLPKNPHFADYLIQTALEKKYGSIKLKPLNDTLEYQTHQKAIKRAKKLNSNLLKYIG